MSNRRKSLVAVIIAATVIFVGSAANAGAALTPAMKDALQAAPVSATDKPDRPEFNADAPPPSEDELKQPTVAQDALANRVTELSTPIDEAKVDPDGVPRQLTEGIVGFYGSPTSGYTVVISSDEDKDAVVSSILSGLPQEASASLTPVMSSVSARQLESAWRAVMKREWAPKDSSFSMDIDPVASQILVRLPPTASGSDAARLLDVAPGLIQVRKTLESSRGSRTNDSSPHWGGAWIASSTKLCSSGFTVYGNGTGAHYSLTAAHCGSNGDTFYSGSYYFGAMAGKSNFPTYDVARVYNSDYEPKIYTDGLDNFTIRDVTAATDGALGSYVCVSGSHSLSTCGLTIDSLTYQFCDPGCTPNLGLTEGANATVQGDSGGPVYFRSTSQARAAVRGTIVVVGTDTAWQRYTTISSHLGVTAWTLP